MLTCESGYQTADGCQWSESAVHTENPLCYYIVLKAAAFA